MNRILILLTLATLVVQSIVFCSHPDRGSSSGNHQTHSGRSLPSPSSLSARRHTSENTKLLLLIIDFDDFMCMNCLESFLSFCFSLPPSVLEENTWGILALEKDKNEKEAERTLKIAQKKLQGFIHAHQIPFPILIDSQHRFQSLAQNGTALLLFEKQRNSFAQFFFPLKKDDAERIKAILLYE